MDKGYKKSKLRLNPNEYGGLLFNAQKLTEIKKILYEKKIFRYATKEISPTDEFENAVKEYLGIRYALGLNNGTTALKTALFCIGIKPKDRVLISAYTFIATAASAISFGAIPIPIDFDWEYGMNLDDLQREIKKGCKAIIPVHLQGRAFNLTPILKIARNKNIPVIEDACQAFGAQYQGEFAGCMADIGTYSFQQYKQMSAGEAGMLVTNNEKYFKIARTYSDHGMIRESMNWEGEEALIGDNYRMNNLQAAILNVQIRKIKTIISSQIKKRNYILKKIKKAGLASIVNSFDISGETGMNILFLTESKDKADQIIAHSQEHHIQFRRIWGKPYYLHGIFKRIKLDIEALRKADCVAAEDISQRLLALSVPPILSTRDLDKLVKEILLLKEVRLLT